MPTDEQGRSYIEYEQGRRVLIDEDDAPELDETFFRHAVHGLDGLSGLIGEAAVAPLRRKGRPKLLSPKRNGTLRLSTEVWDGLKASGRGYSARVEAILREALEQGRI